jgi:predicted RecA/RadA family phage recombinase
MAANREHEHGTQFQLDVSTITGSGAAGKVVSGDPGVVGELPVVALTDADDDDVATVQTDGVWRLTVSGSDDMGNAAVTAGAIVYWDDVDGEVNIDAANGVRFGYALAAVGAGADTEILVKLGY